MILQVGSALAYRGIPLQAAYCAAKHAIQGFQDSLRSELIHDGSRVRTTMVHLPATNTPQHSWSKNRMRFRPRPVPPIFQPEVAARAIYHAAHHDRREWTVGLITDVVLAGNALLPGVGDWYLAKTGYESQLTDEPDDPGRPHNLYEPVPGDWGAHGRFDAVAHETSGQWMVTKNRGWLALAGLAGLALFAATRVGRNDGPAQLPTEARHGEV
jgi:hypothetical protein